MFFYVYIYFSIYVSLGELKRIKYWEKWEIISPVEGIFKSGDTYIHVLTSDMTEVTKQEIRIDHIDMDIVKIILAYMYTEDFSVHKDQLMDVIIAADYLHMNELKEMCLEEVPAILEVDNVLEWWQMCGKIDLDTTKEHCEELMATAFVNIRKQRIPSTESC